MAELHANPVAVPPSRALVGSPWGLVFVVVAIAANLLASGYLVVELQGFSAASEKAETAEKERDAAMVAASNAILRRAEADAEVADLLQQKTLLTSAVAELEKRAENAKVIVEDEARAKANLDILEGRIRASEANLTVAQKRSLDLRDQAADQAKQIESVHQDIEELTKNRVSLEGEVTRLESAKVRLVETETHALQAERRTTAATEEMKVAEQRKIALAAEIDELRKQANALGKSVASLETVVQRSVEEQQKIEVKRLLLAELEKQELAAKDSATQRKAERDALSKERDALLESVATLRETQRQAMDVQQQASVARARVAELQKQEQESKASLQELSGQVAKLRETEAELRKSMGGLRETARQFSVEEQPNRTPVNQSAQTQPASN